MGKKKTDLTDPNSFAALCSMFFRNVAMSFYRVLFRENGHLKPFVTANILLGLLLLGSILVSGFRFRPSWNIAKIPEPTQRVRQGYAEEDWVELMKPVREEPKRFRMKSRLPGQREVNYSGAINLARFNPDADLVRIEDERVWWESDHDDHTNDTEDDHLVHRAMEIKLRRLIELTCAAGGELRVQDSYRDSGIHTKKSMHKEGRAVDVTCSELGLEKLAKLAYAAGFDWVYYEGPKSAHVHASVKHDIIEE